jgi:hypothetical protein
MRGVVTLRNKQYGEHRLSPINNSGESIKNSEYLLEFEAKFAKSLNIELGAWEESICEKIVVIKSRWTVPLSGKLIGSSFRDGKFQPPFQWQIVSFYTSRGLHNTLLRPEFDPAAPHSLNGACRLFHIVPLSVHSKPLARDYNKAYTVQ